MQVPAEYEQGTDEESAGDDEEIDSEGGSDVEVSILIVGRYGENGEHQDDGRCDRGMDKSDDYRCECKWGWASTVIVQGMGGLRAVEETEKICFGCAEDRCRCKPCELRADEEDYEEEDGTARPEFGTYSLRNENEMVDMASRNETAASPAILRVQQENLGRRRTEAEVDFEEPRRGGPGYRSLDEESVGQGRETSRTDQESLVRRGEIVAYLKRIQWRAWALMGMEISWGVPNDNETARGTEQRKEMEENSRENEYTARELMSVAVKKYNWLAGQEGISNRMEEAEMEITFRGHVRSLLEDMECNAMTWMQGSDGQWRVIENMVGRLWALRHQPGHLYLTYVTYLSKLEPNSPLAHLLGTYNREISGCAQRAET